MARKNTGIHDVTVFYTNKKTPRCHCVSWEVAETFAALARKHPEVVDVDGPLTPTTLFTSAEEALDSVRAFSPSGPGYR